MTNFLLNLLAINLCILLTFPSPILSARLIAFNVLNFGAEPDGFAESSKSFLSAWDAACNAIEAAMIIVPKGRYLLHPITFQGGSCNYNDIIFYVDGTLIAPHDYKLFGDSSSWLDFQDASGIMFAGDGILDAKGSSLWACKDAGEGSHCPFGATTLSFTNSSNIVIRGITSLNSQMFHIVINNCTNVLIEGVQIRSPGNSPNTDGVHVQLSMNVTIANSSIKTGDDCISIGPGTKNLLVDHVACGPSHGISIGSLAKDMDEEGVVNVTVKTVVLTHSTNGLRIKSWGRPSNAFVRGVLFQDVLMRNVSNPIIIDQNYCPDNNDCPHQESGAKISDVMYQDIRGTSTTEVAVKFDCSATSPCTGILLQNVNLTYHDSQAAQSYCSNATGKALGVVQPPSCL